MNRTEENLQQLISLMGKRNIKAALVAIGTVQNIDEQNRSCEIRIDDDLTLFNCRLNAVLDSYQNHLLIVPKDQSAVAFICVDGKPTDPLIIAYSEIEKVMLTIGESDILIEDGKIKMNGGDLGGLINIEDLVSHINTIENDINNLKTALSGWTPIPQDGGAALKTAVTTWAGQQITKTKKSDIEDTKVTH